MKNLLGVFGAVVLASGAPLLVSNSNVQADQNEVYSNYQFYGNAGHSKKTISVDTPGNQAAVLQTHYTFNLGSSANVRHMLFSNSDGFYFSGGNTRYGNGYFGERDISLNASTNAVINNSNFDQYLQFTVYDETVTDFLAKMYSTAKVGYAGYQESGNYYLQVLCYQYLKPVNSISGGSNGASLGDSLILY